MQCSPSSEPWGLAAFDCGWMPKEAMLVLLKAPLLCVHLARRAVILGPSRLIKAESETSISSVILPQHTKLLSVAILPRVR